MATPSSVHAHKAVIRAHNAVTRVFNAVIWAHNAVTRAYNAVTRAYNAVTRTFNAVTRAYNAVTRTFNAVTRAHNAFTRVYKKECMACRYRDAKEPQLSGHSVTVRPTAEDMKKLYDDAEETWTPAFVKLIKVWC